MILNWLTIYTGTVAEFPLAYSNKVFFAMITSRSLGTHVYDCMNVYALSLTGGTFEEYGTNGSTQFTRARFVTAFGY